MRFLAAFALLSTVVLQGIALAVQPDEILSDAKLEARARDISRELRCMVCQNQSIDDSDAPLARDLRILVRQRLEAGDSDTQVRDFLVARYGDFVLLRPPVKWDTLVLWAAAPVILLGGIAALYAAARRRKPVPVQGPTLTEDEKKRLATLVESGRLDA